MNGGGVFLNKNILSKTKQGLVVGILLCSGIGKVRAITTNEVTYNNNGVEENLTETLDTLYTELKGYKTGGNVTPSEMLEGYSGYSKGILIEGSIKKKEATTYTPGVNDITLNKGQYLNGNQVIKGDTNLKPENIKSGVSLFGIHGTYTSDANASANQILSGKTAYVKGSKVTGTMVNKSGATVEASTITSDENYNYITVPESGYYDTSSIVSVKKVNSNIETGFVINSINVSEVDHSNVGAARFSMTLNFENLKTMTIGSHSGTDYFIVTLSNGQIYNLTSNGQVIDISGCTSVTFTTSWIGGNGGESATINNIVFK